MKFNVPVITGAKAIVKAIDANRLNGISYQAKLHELAMSVLLHVAKHGDVRMVDYFVTAQIDSTRTNSLKKWFEKYGPVMFDNDGIHYVKRDKPVSRAAGEAEPFWKLVAMEGVAYIPLDVEKEINSLITKLEKDAKKAGTSHSATIIELRKLVKRAPVALAA